MSRIGKIIEDSTLFELTVLQCIKQSRVWNTGYVSVSILWLYKKVLSWITEYVAIIWVLCILANGRGVIYLLKSKQHFSLIRNHYTLHTPNLFVRQKMSLAIWLIYLIPRIFINIILSNRHWKKNWQKRLTNVT